MIYSLALSEQISQTPTLEKNPTTRLVTKEKVLKSHAIPSLEEGKCNICADASSSLQANPPLPSRSQSQESLLARLDW